MDIGVVLRPLLMERSARAKMRQQAAQQRRLSGADCSADRDILHGAPSLRQNLPHYTRPRAETQDGILTIDFLYHLYYSE